MTALQYFGSIRVNISPKHKKRTLLKSTQKRLLKNVQDGISRPLGSQEIQKTKVERVLLDTL